MLSFLSASSIKKEIVFLKYVIGVHKIRMNDVKIRIILD
jgi:hypothetical protein